MVNLGIRSRRSAMIPITLWLSLLVTVGLGVWLLDLLPGQGPNPVSVGSDQVEKVFGDSSTPNYSGGHFDWLGPYSSLDVRIDRSDLIVVGKVVAVDRVVNDYPDNYDVADPHRPKGISGGLKFSILRVEVTEYLKGSGPPELTMRQVGDLIKTDGYREFPKPPFNVPMILFLSEVEGDVSLYDAGPWSQVIDDAGVVSYNFQGEEGGLDFRTVEWFRGRSFSEVPQLIREVVAQQRPVSP